jgi:AraC-like DNA-binding protein
LIGAVLIAAIEPSHRAVSNRRPRKRNVNSGRTLMPPASFLQPWLGVETPEDGTPVYRERSFRSGSDAFSHIVWSLRRPADARGEFNYVAVPDACADIIVELGSGHGFICGIADGAMHFSIKPGEHYVGLRLAAHTFSSLVRMPAGELAHRVVPCDDAGRRYLVDVFLPWREGAPFEINAEAISSALGGHLCPSWIEPRAMHACSTLFESPHAFIETDVARRAGLCARQVRRVMLAHVGLAPKQLARVLRFQRALARLVQGLDPLALVAAESDFSDQAHMTREFAALSGFSPGFWRNRHNVRFVQSSRAAR